jgi:outer membrane protein assembly factor BamB
MYALGWDTVQAGRPVVLWKVRTGGPICCEPVFDGRNLFFASAEGRVYSCVGFNRILNWAFETAGSVQTGLLLHENGIYVASGDRSLYRLDDGVGRVRWQRRLPTPLDEAPVVAGQTVYQHGPEEGLFAVALDSGELLWRCGEARAFVAARGQEAYLASADGEHLLAVDNRTGQVLRSLEVPDTAVMVCNPRDDAIYLVSAWKRVLCLRPADVPYLTLEEIAAVRERLSRGGDRTDEAIQAAPATETGSRDDLLDDPLRSRRDIAPVSGG